MSAGSLFAYSAVRSYAVLLTALLAGCGLSDNAATAPVTFEATEVIPPAGASAGAREVAMSSIIVDTHIDVPYRINEEWVDVTEATEGGDFDYPRAVAGGLNAAFMSIYTPAELQAEGGARQLAEKLIDMVNDIAARAPDKFAMAYSPLDIEKQFADGVISLPLGMENGAPIEDDLANVGHFYDRGIRYITLAHSLSNLISDSSYDDKKWGGLSEFGVAVIGEMNRLGIMVDVSHISDEAFWDVMEVTKAPAIASHSSARHFTPGWERNMADDMIVRLAENHGLLMINFGSDFLTKEAYDYSNARRNAFQEYAEQSGIDTEDEDARSKFAEQYAAEHGPYPFATLEQTLDHFDHVVQLTSVDYVGIGSDYDGVGDSLPTGLKDVSSYPNLVEGLLQRGYSNEEIRKILGENLLRVWREVEEVARAL